MDGEGTMIKLAPWKHIVIASFFFAIECFVDELLLRMVKNA